MLCFKGAAEHTTSKGTAAAASLIGIFSHGGGGRGGGGGTGLYKQFNIWLCAGPIILIKNLTQPLTLATWGGKKRTWIYSIGRGGEGLPMGCHLHFLGLYSKCTHTVNYSYIFWIRDIVPIQPMRLQCVQCHFDDKFQYTIYNTIQYTIYIYIQYIRNFNLVSRIQ